MSKSKFTKYLFYGIGEVILVVIGILIAINVSKSNERKKERAQLDGILTSIKDDLVRDTISINQAITYYKLREGYAEKILKNEYEEKDSILQASYLSFLTFFSPVSLNEKGYKELENFYTGSKRKDSLAISISGFYESELLQLQIIESEIEESTMTTLKHWRDNYPWFSDMMVQKVGKDLMDYTRSQDYKNRVGFYYALACKGLPPLLEKYKTNATRIIEEIDQNKKVN